MCGIIVVRNKTAAFIICVSMLMLSVSGISAQHQHNFFYGKVSEEGTTRGLQGVNLHIEGTHIGTVTDKKGNFSFFTDSIPVQLTVSYVGFETRVLLLDETSFSLSLYLKRSVQELNEVEIRSNLLESFFRDNHYSILDYDIDSSLVWMLIYRQHLSNTELICKNLTGDTVSVSAPFTFRPTGLFRDCIGMLHVLSHDSGYQVFSSGRQIFLIHGVRLKKFDDVLKNCVASNVQTLFFKRLGNQGLSVEYFGVDRQTLSRKTIARVEDEKKIKMTRRNQEDASLLMSMRPPDSRDDFVTWNYVHKILYRPVKAQLFVIGNYTAIFNNPDRQVEFYDNQGNFSYKLALQVEKINDGRWTQDIVIDRTSDKIYTTFLRNGTCTIYEIDPNNGNLKKRLSLTHPFPEKIRVYNGWVYYLYDESAEADNKMMFRQKL